MRVLIAPDSFKGSLTSVEVARAIAAGWLRARPGDDVQLAPLADGGEGTLVAVEASGGWAWREADALDPLGRPIRARWLAREDGDGGVRRDGHCVRAEPRGARRAGRGRAPPATGTGDLLRAVLDAGIRDIALGIGGSATTDGGAGLLRALGARVTDDLASVDLSGLDRRLAETTLRIACDVTNPLLGERGAAAVYGPQKGATAGRRPAPRRAARPLRGRARGRDRPPRARDAGRGRRGWRRASGCCAWPTGSRPCASNPASTSSWPRPASTRSSRTPTS